MIQLFLFHKIVDLVWLDVLVQKMLDITTSSV